MAKLKAPEASGTLDWTYDAEADVLYLSAGAPRPATSIDAGDGLLVRYEEATGEIVGLTVIDFIQRAADALRHEGAPPDLRHDPA